MKNRIYASLIWVVIGIGLSPVRYLVITLTNDDFIPNAPQLTEVNDNISNITVTS